MAEELVINNRDTKEQRYKTIIPQIKSLIEGETNMIANLANISAALKQGFDFFWVGFYLVENTELVLGPFQGTIPCTRIRKGKGVCGATWEKKETLVVPNVEDFPGHIACSSASKSEIVVPVFNSQREVMMVLDVDSDKLNDFDEVDKKYLEELVKSITFKI